MRHFIRRFPRSLSLLLLTAVLGPAGSALAQGPPCKPCAGILVDDPRGPVTGLETEPRLADEERLYVAWPVALDEVDDVAAEASALREAGARPWLRLIFRTPRPVTENAARLGQELERAAEVARAAGTGSHFQILWQPDNDAGGADATAATADYAFLLKRASVAVAGAADDSIVVTAALAADPEALSALYAEDVAAYVQGVALAPAPKADLDAALARLAELDPGKPVVLDAAPWPQDPRLTLSEAARWAAQGFSLSFFKAPSALTAADLAPLKVLAREFQGDLSLDPYSKPEGGEEAWSFVRGEDLQLRVVVRAPQDSGELDLSFPDSQLTRPSKVDPETGETYDIFGQQRSADAFKLRVDDPGPVALLRVERMSAEEIEGLEGLEEKVTVAGERQIPVEEILRRLQAFQDAQDRRLDHYQAINTMHLRFASGAGVQNFEASLEGPFFFARGKGFDWAWQTLYFNGVRWRGKELPEFPLLQPEKAAALPLEINFSKEYSYRLRGSDTVDGRACWVVDFSPAGETTGGRTLYQGTVWVDKEHFGPVRTRALQVGLEGEVLSNEETFYFTPVTPDTGTASDWTPESFWLPLRVVGQQLVSVLNASILIEKETVLTALELNGPEFESRREAVLASDSTMVRDTDKGLRYLVKDEAGERQVQEGFDPSRRFVAAGVLWDESFDYPLPLGGIDFFSFDYRGTGKQVNLLFAGALLVGNIADPDVFGSKWDAGANVFALAVAGSDTPYQDGEEVLPEKIESRPANVSLFLGHPLGSFGKLDLTYTLGYVDYGTSDDTADDFVVPKDQFTHTFRLETSFTRNGYRLVAGAEETMRSDWQPWGRPGSATLDAFDPDTEQFTLWNFGAAKSWWLPKFQKVGLEVEYRDGRNLDRFSKYQFGYFSSIRVHGYQSDKVRASSAYATHLTYGFEFGEQFRLELVGDAAWATDDETGLDNEFLGGVGITGNFIGPWNTLVNLDLGVAVAGPDDGVSVFVTFLKLLK
ncbi:MAG: hypothetical protein KDD11_19465 [Acidobacteria bacterium]|nr:hypothetical protein [Acidobacteriota bacterium]